MKFFKEESSRLKLSELMKKTDEELDCSYKKRSLRTEYIISAIGDVELSIKDYFVFLDQFSYFGGRYDVRLDKDTFAGVYGMLEKYHMLSSKATELLFCTYIKDLFETYDLTDVLQDFIDKYGQSDDTFEKYYEYVQAKADELDLTYIEESKKAETLTMTHGKKFADHVLYMIRCKHYLYDDIDKWIPSSKIIRDDEEVIADFSQKTRIFFGCCQPVSYSMLEDLVKDRKLEYGERPRYTASHGYTQDASFTVQEYLDSVKERQKIKVKILTRE